MDGFAGVKTLVNDAAVAHFAAFGDGPGIVSIQGTGSTIRALLEDGRVVRNGDFMHYAAAGALRVGLAGVQMILTNPYTERDVALWNAAFDLWEVASPEALRTEVGRLRALEVRERSRRLGEFARAITASAEAGWLHSGAVCWTATKEIVRGVRLLGPSFVADSVDVALFGACGRSPAMRDSLARGLARAKEKRYRIVEPDVKPVVGAVLMALRDQGMAIDEGTIRQTSGSWCAPNDEER